MDSWDKQHYYKLGELVLGSLAAAIALVWFVLPMLMHAVLSVTGDFARWTPEQYGGSWDLPATGSFWAALVPILILAIAAATYSATVTGNLVRTPRLLATVAAAIVVIWQIDVESHVLAVSAEHSGMGNPYLAAALVAWSLPPLLGVLLGFWSATRLVQQMQVIGWVRFDLPPVGERPTGSIEVGASPAPVGRAVRGFRGGRQ